MGGKVLINSAQRKVGPLGLKLLWTRGTSISGALRVRNQIGRMVLEGRTKVLVTSKYLAATFDEKEILVIKGSADYARILARNGVSEIKFEKETGENSVGYVLDVLAGRGVKACQRILARSSMRVEIQDRGQKIPEEIPDCIQMEVNDFIDQLAIERFLKQEKHEETDTLAVLEIILNKFRQTRDFPKNFVARLTPFNLRVIEDALIRNVGQFRAIAPFFLEHPNATSQFLLCLIENEIVKDGQSAIEFAGREGLTIQQKAEIILAAAKRMVITNPESIFEFLEKNLDKSPYRGSKYQEYVKEILWAMVNSRNTRGLKAVKVKDLAETYNIPIQEIEKYMVEMLMNGKIIGEEALAMAANEFVPAELVAIIISMWIPKSGERYEETREVIPAHEVEDMIPLDKTGMMFKVETKWVEETVIVHEKRTRVYLKDDYERAANIIKKHSSKKQETILKMIPAELADGIRAFFIET